MLGKTETDQSQRPLWVKSGHCDLTELSLDRRMPSTTETNISLWSHMPRARRILVNAQTQRRKLPYRIMLRYLLSVVSVEI
jgi:hypothetical protein